MHARLFSCTKTPICVNHRRLVRILQPTHSVRTLSCPTFPFIFEFCSSSAKIVWIPSHTREFRTMPTFTPPGLTLDFDAPITKPKQRPTSSFSKDFCSNEGALKTFAHFTTVANKHSSQSIKRKPNTLSTSPSSSSQDSSSDLSQRTRSMDVSRRRK